MSGVVLGNRGPFQTDPFDTSQGYNAPPGTVTVEEIIAMSSAGVKIDFEQVANRIRPMPQKQTYHRTYQDELTRMIVERWHMGLDAKDNEFRRFPFHLSATVHGETVYVFVHALEHSVEPMIIKDEKAIFPSDRLLANLHLMLQQPVAQPTDVPHNNPGIGATCSGPVHTHPYIRTP